MMLSQSFHAFALVALVTMSLGCGGSTQTSEPSPPGTDAGTDAGSDAGTDAGTDAGSDAGSDCRVTSVQEQRDIAYKAIPGVDPNFLSLDVYVPLRAAGCPAAPLVVWVHGGGWARGDKSNKMDDKVELFTSKGWVVASVNYRLSERRAQGQTVQYPMHNQDVAAAIAWLVQNSAQWNANAEELLVFGHSAGAGIVSQIATNERFLEAEGLNLSALRCVAMLDTEAYDVRAMCEEGVELYLNAFGSDPEVWDEASAINHVEAGKGIPASLVVTRGEAPRRQLNQRFVTLLKDAGVPASLVDASPLSHEEVNDAVGQAGDRLVTPPLMDFFAGCLE